MVTCPLLWEKGTEAKTDTQLRLIPLISPKQEKANLQKTEGTKPQAEEDTAAGGGDGVERKSVANLEGAGPDSQDSGPQDFPKSTI